jgi:hypothetical protein
VFLAFILLLDEARALELMRGLHNLPKGDGPLGFTLLPFNPGGVLGEGIARPGHIGFGSIVGVIHDLLSCGM